MGISAILFLVVVLWLLLTEFSYFGFRRIQQLYDWCAPRYEVKWTRPAYANTRVTSDLFVTPLRQALERWEEPQLLDLACGTGRVSLLMLREDWFRGRIQAVDGSDLMLDQFRRRLAEFPTDRADFVQVTSSDLTTWTAGRAAEFDAVVFAEAGELVPGFRRLVGEVSRSLRPGGLFLLTKPPDWLAWLFFGRDQSSRKLQRLLHQHGFVDYRVSAWRWRYSVVYVTKRP